MFKVIWMMRRKAGITHEQFRAHYENNHAMMGKKYFGHLWTEYRRNYVTSASGGSPAPDGGFQPLDLGYDCVAEWVFPSRAEYEELLRIAADPEIGREFFEDEARFLERSALVVMEVDMVDTGTGIEIAVFAKADAGE